MVPIARQTTGWPGPLPLWGTCFVGYAAGSLRAPPHTRHLPVTACDAHTAELAALFIALAITAACDGQNFSLVGDCTSALDIARGSAASHSHRTLATAVLSLHLVAKERLNSLSFSHTHSHQGLPVMSLSTLRPRSICTTQSARPLTSHFSVDSCTLIN